MTTKIVDANGGIIGSSEILSSIHQQQGLVGPGYKANSYYAATNFGHNTQAALSSVASVANTMYLTPFHVSKTAYFQSIAMWCVTSSSVIVFGIYNGDGNGQPTGDVIPGTQSGNISTSSGAITSFTFASPLLLTGGKTYWPCYYCGATPTMAKSADIGFTTGLGKATMLGTVAATLGYSQFHIGGLTTISSPTAMTSADITGLIFLRAK